MTKTVIAGPSSSLPAPTGNLFPADRTRCPIRSGMTETVIAGPDRQSLPHLSTHAFAGGACKELAQICKFIDLYCYLYKYKNIADILNMDVRDLLNSNIR